ncbi:hypothetical protein MJT46_004852 [Ovis ammon polii x Ovis aries]|nr:hypothetical protein MJT46_004852 [Ovis ammon polii x Ovis aries]
MRKRATALRGQKEVLRRTDTEKLEETARFRTLSKPVPTGETQEISTMISQNRSSGSVFKNVTLHLSSSVYSSHLFQMSYVCHVGSLSAKSSFHQLSWQDPPGVGQEAAPAGAHQPSMEPLEETVSAISPAPLTQDPVPLASTLSAEPEDRSNLENIPFGTVAKSSPPDQLILHPRSKQKAKEDPAWEIFLGPTVPVNFQTSNMDLRRSDEPVTKKTLPPPTNAVGRYSKEPRFKTQVAGKFEFGSNLESENQLQGQATGDLLQQSHTDVLLQDYTTGMLLQDFATNLLLQDPHTDVFLAADILASHRSSSQMEHASGDTPASQVPYDLKASAQSTQKQQKFQKPKDPFKSQREMLAPTEEWRDFQSFQPGEHEEVRSIQRPQTPRKPKVRDPRKGLSASADDGETCEKLEPEEDRETISQGKMFAPTEERRGFKRPQQEEDEDMKSKREMLTIIDEWRKASRLQSRGKQKPKVRDPCKGPFASIQEERICENLELEEDEEINRQIEMCPPAGEWWSFNKPLPRGHQETESQSKIFTSTEACRAFKGFQPGEPEEMKSQRERLTPTEEWKSIRRLQPGEQDPGSRQRQEKKQEPRKPKVRDPCKGPFASIDEGEVCEKPESEEDEEMNSQSAMCPPAGEWRGFKKPPPKGHEETKSSSEMLTSPEDYRAFKGPQPRKSEEAKSQKMITPAEEWRSVRRLQPGEHEIASRQRQQKPRKPKVRDPCKGPFASVDEGEVCERPKPEEDEEMHSQSRMLAPPDERKGNWRPKLGQYEERLSGLRASHTSVMSQSPQARETESLGSKYLHFSPEEERLLAESYLKKRMRHFLQCLSPNKKDKQIEETFQKGRPASAAAQCQEQIKDKFIVDGKIIDPEVIGTVVGQILVEKLGLQQGTNASEVNHHREQLQALEGGHSHHHRTLSSSEQRKMLKNPVHSHQANPKDHRHLSKIRHTRDRGDRDLLGTLDEIDEDRKKKEEKEKEAGVGREEEKEDNKEEPLPKTDCGLFCRLVT